MLLSSLHYCSFHPAEEWLLCEGGRTAWSLQSREDGFPLGWQQRLDGLWTQHQRSQVPCGGERCGLVHCETFALNLHCKHLKVTSGRSYKGQRSQSCVGVYWDNQAYTLKLLTIGSLFLLYISFWNLELLDASSLPFRLPFQDLHVSVLCNTVSAYLLSSSPLNCVKNINYKCKPHSCQLEEILHCFACVCSALLLPAADWGEWCQCSYLRDYRFAQPKKLSK